MFLLRAQQVTTTNTLTLLIIYTCFYALVYSDGKICYIRDTVVPIGNFETFLLILFLARWNLPSRSDPSDWKDMRSSGMRKLTRQQVLANLAAKAIKMTPPPS
eukprot:755372-Hanusia_phi.AAC.6